MSKLFFCLITLLLSTLSLLSSIPVSVYSHNVDCTSDAYHINNYTVSNSTITFNAQQHDASKCCDDDDDECVRVCMCMYDADREMYDRNVVNAD